MRKARQQQRMVSLQPVSLHSTFPAPPPQLHQPIAPTPCPALPRHACSDPGCKRASSLPLSSPLLSSLPQPCPSRAGAEWGRRGGGAGSGRGRGLGCPLPTLPLPAPLRPRLGPPQLIRRGRRGEGSGRGERSRGEKETEERETRGPENRCDAKTTLKPASSGSQPTRTPKPILPCRPTSERTHRGEGAEKGTKHQEIKLDAGFFSGVGGKRMMPAFDLLLKGY